MTLQKAYSEQRKELRTVRRALPASKGSASGRSGPKLGNKEPTSIEGRIQRQGKKYLIFYRLWVPETLFPLSPWPNIDPRSHLRWASPQGKIDGARAELYAMLPEELYQAAETLADFPLLVRSCLLVFLSLINSVHTSSVALSITSGQVSSTQSRVLPALYSLRLGSRLIPLSSSTRHPRRKIRASSGSCTETVKPTLCLVPKVHTTV